MTFADKMDAILNARFTSRLDGPSDEHFHWMRHYKELLVEYQQSGLAPPHLLTELQDNKIQKFWAGLWEAMLYRHFRNLGFKFRQGNVTKAGQNGPDFGLIYGNQTIWIEAVVPMPGETLEVFTNRKPNQAYDVPHEQMLLPWIGALRSKLIQYVERIEKGVVDVNDAYVIAVNSCMISSEPGHEEDDNTLPFAVTSVYPLGPLAVPVDQSAAGPRFGNMRLTQRYSLKKPNGSQVPTDSFLNPDYAGISALIGSNRNKMLDGSFYPVVVHNVLAGAKLPPRLFGASEEWVAEKDEDGNCTLFRNSSETVK